VGHPVNKRFYSINIQLKSSNAGYPSDIVLLIMVDIVSAAGTGTGTHPRRSLVRSHYQESIISFGKLTRVQ
jgi:hypothetical protein